MDIPKPLNELMEFMCSFSKLEGGKELYGELDKFFQKRMETSPMVVFAKPRDGSKIHSKELAKACRTLWNRNFVGKDPFSAEMVELNLLKACEGEPIFKSWKEYDSGNGFYYSVYCGHSDQQVFFGILYKKEKLDAEILDYMVRYLSNLETIVSSFSELKKMEDLAHVDDVTGLYNQRKLFKDLDQSILKHKDYKEEFSVLFIDIDHFKSVNDGHGHMVGTHLLHELADLLKKVLRETDMIYRYGGDEFVMIIPDSNTEIAKIVGKRILNAVKNNEFTNAKSDEIKGTESFKLSVSIGVAGFPSDAKTREEILDIADKMMYEAKEAGRGQVCHAGKLISG
ncbi:MAG: hypothetical protein CME70_20240 [Halobacteriovorax sp.]|nr:hypothetical protein [Halobacteriovorax sp.]